MDNIFELISKNEWLKLDNEIDKISDNPDENYINYRDKNNNYLINYLVLFNKVELIRKIIRKGGRIDILDNEGRTILYHAIKLNYIDIIKVLLEENRSIFSVSIINLKDKEGLIPIHYALKSKSKDIIKLLLDNNADTNILDNMGNNSLQLSLFTRDDDIVEMIMRNIKNINHVNNIGESALHIGVDLQYYNGIKRLLDKKINVNIQNNKNQYTALHKAVNNNNEKIVNELLINKADINIQDIYGNNVLFYSISQNNYKLFEILINSEQKINYNIWNVLGNTALNTILTNDISLENKIMYIDKIIEYSNVNIINLDGKTPLHYLCVSNLWKRYKNVLKIKKLDISIRDNIGNQPIYYIDDKDKDDFISLIIDSYMIRLKKNKDWMNEWENICSKELNLEVPKKKKLDECKKEIRKKIETIIKSKDLDICIDVSYPIKKTHFCPEILKNEGLNYCSFVGTTLDILFGLIYILKKHNEVCSSLSMNLLENYEYKKFYESLGIKLENRLEFLNYEILWAYKRLFFSDKIVESIKNCQKKSKINFIIIPLGIELKRGEHANYLIYDRVKNEIERFEPQGSNFPEDFNYEPNILDNLLENKFLEIIPNVKYIRPIDYLPKVSFQLIDSKENKRKIGDPEGFCALWAIWYVDLRLTYKNIERKKLVKYMIHYIKKNKIFFKDYIRNFSQNIIKIRDNILNKANIDINQWLNDDFSNDQLKIIIKEINNEISKLII